MAINPIKINAWSQGLYEVSDTKSAGYTGPFVGHAYASAFVSGYFTPVVLKYD